MKITIAIFLIALVALTVFTGCTTVPAETNTSDTLGIDENSDSDIIQNLEVEFIPDDDYVELGEII